MSLMDALLNEGYRDPRDVYIALRTDGAKGSGTIDDPYDGGAFQENIRSAVVGKYLNDQTGRTAFVVLTSHGFSDGDLVAIRGATNSRYNGDFFIFNVTADQFFYMMGAAPDGGAGSSTTCAGVVLRFDEVMESTPANAAIHIGPGVFETKGYSPQSPAWQPKAGQNIRGSGMGVTTLKLVGARAPINGAGQPTHVIGAHYYPFLDHLEITDLTIDCNLPGQIAPQGKDFAEVSCGAIFVPGNYIRIQRVRAIHFGTQTTAIECFVIGTAGAHPLVGTPVHCVIEDCVCELPSVNNVRETTILGMVGMNEDRGAGSRRFFDRGCVIRHCFVDCNYPGGKSSFRNKIEGIAQVSGRQYKLTTKAPHERVAGNNIVLNNVYEVVSGISQPSLVFQGSFKVDAVDVIDPDHALLFTLPADHTAGTLGLGSAFIGVNFHAMGGGGGTGQVIEGNSIWNTLVGGPYSDTDPTGDIIVRDNYYSNVRTGAYFLLGTVNPTSVPIALKTFSYDAADPTIAIAETWLPHGFVAGNKVTITGAAGADKDRYNGTFDVLANPPPTASVFRYQMSGSVSTSPGAGVGYFTLERLRRLASLSYALENGVYVATAEAGVEHGLAVGDAIRIDHASKSAFNAFHTVSAVPDATTFKFILNANPDPPNTSGSSPSGYWGHLWQVGSFVAEGNVADLTVGMMAYGTQAGIALHHTRYPDPSFTAFIFRRVLLRNNLARQLNDAVDPNHYSVGISAQGCETAIAEGNVVKLPTSTPLQYWGAGTMRSFANTDATGQSLSWYNQSASRAMPSEEAVLAQKLEDAMTMAFL